MPPAILYIGPNAPYQKMREEFGNVPTNLMYAGDIFTAVKKLNQSSREILAVVVRHGDGIDLDERVLKERLPCGKSVKFFRIGNCLDGSDEHLDGIFSANMTGKLLLAYLQSLYPEKVLF